MGRPERPLDPSGGAVAAFAQDLRELRGSAGNPSYRALARTALFAPSVLSSAAGGRRLPTLPVTLAFVSACGGDPAAWEHRWNLIAAQLGMPFEPAAPDAAGPAGPDAGDQAGAAGPPAGATGPGETLPAQLPPSPGIFVGRERELTAARRLVAAGTAPALLVSGPVGVGKTAFALQLAERVATDYPDGRLYADLGQCDAEGRSVAGIVRGFLCDLGIPAAALPEDASQQLGLFRSLLARRRVFVLLTDVSDERLVRPLLGQATRSQVVLTSRARLLGLETTHRLELAAFTRAESVELLSRLAGHGRVRDEPAAADAIAELCGDLPLALNIIGRRIAARPQWALAHTAGQLADPGQELAVLTVGDVSVRDRFATAYDRLSGTAQAAVHQVASSRARWVTSIGAAVALQVPVDAGEELLESLVDAGLLGRADGAGRYAVSALLGVFAAEVRPRPARLETAPPPGRTRTDGPTLLHRQALPIGDRRH